MLNKLITVTLLSDLCPASGDGFGGYVDTDVCFEDNGLPFIPGKRLKGVLRECGLDILSVDDSYAGIFKKLFGEPGKLTPGEITIGNGRLENYEAIKEGLTEDFHRSEITEIYTSMRTRTKMENGKACDGSLRIARVLNKGEKFEFPVTFPLTLDKVPLEFLVMCVKSLRGFGLNRSRGLGEVKCEISDCPKDNDDKFPLSEYANEKAFSYVLTLTEPVISAERSGKLFSCEDYIFGSALIGAFAVKYIKKYALKPEDACLDSNFRRIFLDGGVKFTAALPYADGKTYFPAPNSLKSNKLGNRLSDESGGIPEEKDPESPICKGLGGYISIDENGTVKKIVPDKSVFLHHARPNDKSRGHANKQDGEFYSYEALSEGQEFFGSVIGNESDLKELTALLKDCDEIKIGRSRTAQYGGAKIKGVKKEVENGVDTTIQPNSLKLAKGDKFRLVVVTPLILENDNGVISTDLSLLERTFGGDFEIIGKFCGETTVAGYYGKWLLPKAQSRAISEGSVIVFKYNGEGTVVSDGFIRIRNNEGFGQFRAEAIPRADAFTLAEKSDNPKPPATKDSPLDEKIRKLRSEKEALAQGSKYGETLEKPPQNSVITRVITSANASKNFGEFTKKLCDIKQPEQKVAALAFAAKKDKMYFKIDKERLTAAHIQKLLEDHAKGNDYAVFVKYLSAAATRIKQKRRSTDAKEGEPE